MCYKLITHQLNLVWTHNKYFYLLLQAKDYHEECGFKQQIKVFFLCL